jgi:Meckel syndrome type 1 protein
MNPISSRHLLATCVPILLAACAAPQGDYPSLQIRPAERIDPDAEAPPPPPATPVPAETLAQAEALKRRAETADGDFQRMAPRAGSAAQTARGAAVASDAWVNAQVAIAMLDSKRSETAAALADLEVLYADRAVRLEEMAPLDAIRADVGRLLAAQDATLARLKGMVGG